MREIVTMASIIQGEAIYSDEMPIISSVYYNRLDRNMLLQADPTIQYIIPGKPRRLYNKDLKSWNCTSKKWKEIKLSNIKKSKNFLKFL